MNSTIIFVMLVVNVVTLFAQEQKNEKKEITDFRHSTEISSYVLADKDFYRLYIPTIASTINNMDKGQVVNGCKSGSSSFDQIIIKRNKIKLSGAYVVLLEPYIIPKSGSFRINKISVLYNQKGDAPPYIKIDKYDNYRVLTQQACSFDGVKYKGYKLFYDSKAIPCRDRKLEKSYNNDKAYDELYEKVLSGREYLDFWNEFLSRINFSFYGSPFFVEVAGDIYPAVIKVFGQEQTMYAMYGIWSDEQRASEYGYEKGDRIYFSEEALVPFVGDKSKAVEELEIKRDLRFGAKTFTYDEVIENKEKIYPLLAWAEEPVNSGMKSKTYNDVGVAFYNGIEIPNAPDNRNNTNGMGLQQCPDMDWYWELFCDCANKVLTYEDKKQDPTSFTNYSDYLYTEQMNQQYDPTIYDSDNSVTPYKVDPENQPEDPFLFNKDCVLLNSKIPEIKDPFAPDAKFSLARKIWEWSDFEYKAKDHYITTEFQKTLLDLKNVYRYFVETKERKYDWNYISGKKQWIGDGDVEINFNIDFRSYADSVWYVGNPFGNYQPYENFNTFSMLDNNAIPEGKPYKLISMECETRDNGLTDLPDYKRYKTKGGHDKKADRKYQKKDWYVTWEYPLVYKDKWGRKAFIGTLKFTTSLWKGENNDIVAAGGKCDGHKRNKYIKIHGSTLSPEQTAYYDKKSQDYRTDQTDVHERAPEEFDKGDAIREIARKIIVAEAFDFSLKTLHYLGSKEDNIVGYTAAAMYETSKRIENRIAQSKSYKIAKEVYKGYVLWKRTMDVLSDIRNTYVQMGEAWNGLLYTARAIGDYCEEALDLKNIRLTKCTDLIPKSSFVKLDSKIQLIQNKADDFVSTLHSLALVTDSLTHGNYGPLNPVIREGYVALQETMLESGLITSNLVDNANKTLDSLKSITMGNSSDQQYLANITRSTFNIITNQRLKVMNNGAKNLAMALYMTESESKQWLSHSRYMQQVGKEIPQKFDQAMTSLNNDSWAVLAGSMYVPRMVDNYITQAKTEDGKK